MNVTVIKKNESVIYNGKIYCHGQSFEADDLIGKSLMERGYVALTAPVSEPETTTTSDDKGKAEYSAPDLEKASYTELKKLAASMGLNASGKKNELIARIIGANQGTEFADEAEADTDEIPDDLPNTDMPE